MKNRFYMLMEPETEASGGGGGEPVQGGLQHGMTMGGDAGATNNPQGTGATAEGAQPIFEYKGKRFATKEDLESYIDNLETQAARDHVRAQAANPQAPVNTLESQINPSAENGGSVIDNTDEMFANPKEWAKKLKDEVRAEVRQELHQKDATKQFWDSFYAKNPDLRNAERIVQSITTERWGTLKDMKAEEAAKTIAQEARNAVDKIRGTSTTRTTELPSGQANALSSTGGSTPTAPSPTAKKTGGFIEQVKALQKTRRVG